MDKPIVGIIMGSKSDWSVMQEAAKVLDKFSVPYKKSVASAHRTPIRAINYATTAKEMGLQVIIAGASGAAHLAGIVAGLTTLPVIGVPIESKSLKGLDSLLSIVQMPPGVPVLTMAINGAENAGLAAVAILALHDQELDVGLKRFREKLVEKIQEQPPEIMNYVEVKS
ncbi:MAG: 5-(carboxyamino)imidazole ribonucleotide mutase [bacterium]|nr:5-(carboxyamino)imidazole ribonucleotide mutase [bacterium]